jgi:hypothetical protein
MTEWYSAAGNEKKELTAAVYLWYITLNRQVVG